MWEFFELGYETYNNNVPDMVKHSPPMIAVSDTLDFKNTYLLVTGPSNQETLTVGLAMTCAAMWTAVAPFCIGMYGTMLISNYLL